jgi:hypothetical protein
MREQFKIVPGAVRGGDTLGTGVALDGDVAVLGARGGNDAYVYRRVNRVWQREATLRPNSSEAMGYGWSVAVDGDTIVVGAAQDFHSATSFAGSAFVYQRIDGLWQFQQKIKPPGLAYGAYFGSRMDLEGDVLVVGAPGGQQGQNRQAAFIYRRDSNGMFVEEQVLEVGDGAQPMDYYYGLPVGLEGGTLVVGMPSNQSLGNAGAVSVFEFDGSQWQLQQVFQRIGRSSGDYFGGSVGISDGQIVVGASAVPGGGATYVFTQDSAGAWTQQAELALGSTHQAFGWDVAISGDAVVSNWINPSNSLRYVSMFRGSGDTWVEEKVLRPRREQLYDMFGYRVAADGGTYLVGAYCDNDKGGEAGGGYVFGDVRIRPKDDTVPVDGTVQFNIAGGEPGAMVLLLVVDGTSVYRAGLNFFDADGKHRFTGVVPATLSGLTLDFLACGYASSGMACESNLTQVSFQ